MEDNVALIESVKIKIDKLLEEINSFEKIRFLGALGSLLDKVKIERDHLPNIVETSIEYGISMALASENNLEMVMPSAEDILKILNKLEEIRIDYIKYINAQEISVKYSDFEKRLRSKVIESTLTVRGEGYRLHVEEVFEELFGLHDDMLFDCYGFDAENILETINYIENGLKHNQVLYEESHRFFLEWLESQDSERLAETYGVGDPFALSKAFQIESGKGPSFKSVGEQFKFNENELEEEGKKVIRALSMKFGDDGDFLHPKFKALPLNDTLVSSKPILFDENTSSHYCFSPRILHRNLFSIAEGLIEKGDNSYYRDKYLGNGSKARSTYFEDKVSNLFSKIFPSYEIHKNLLYRDTEQYEIDILIEGEDCIYLIEVKSGLFSNAAKRGAIDNLKSDLKDFVGYAATQVSRTEDFILNGGDNFFYYKNGREIHVDNRKKIFKIVVSFASIIGITNQLFMLSELGVIHEKKAFPLAISVFDLMVLADIFDNNEEEFKKYLNSRIELYQEENFVINNEMDFLGLFISGDFNRIIELFNNNGAIQVESNYKEILDNYYNSLYNGGVVQKPEIVKPIG